MQKIAVLGILMPMLMMASDQPTTKEQLVLRGSAVLSWHRPVPAKDLSSVYNVKDAKWLNIALGTEIDPETPLLRVLIDANDGVLPRFLSDRIRFRSNKTQESTDFPSWLPLAWFKDVQDGAVVTAKLFGRSVEIVCSKQIGGSPFHEELAKLMGPQQWVECELREMGDTTAAANTNE